MARSRAASFGPPPPRLSRGRSAARAVRVHWCDLAAGRYIPSHRERTHQRAFSESQRPLAKKAGKTGLLTNDLIVGWQASTANRTEKFPPIGSIPLLVRGRLFILSAFFDQLP